MPEKDQFAHPHCSLVPASFKLSREEIDKLPAIKLLEVGVPRKFKFKTPKDLSWE